jgi:uncharacterized protein
MNTILWHRLDRDGHESARLRQSRGTWHLDGTAVFAHERRPCRLDYAIVCDAAWRTLSTRVSGWVGDEPVTVSLVVDMERGWWLNGTRCPDVDRCLDVDLNFSPATNLLPIRRLDLAVGAEATVTAAWLRFPSFNLEPLTQVYRRTGERNYRYESDGCNFVADLMVDEAGFVTRYPGLADVDI